MGWDLSELKRRAGFVLAFALFAAVVLVLALVYVAGALHAAWLLVLPPALASICTAASLLLILLLKAAALVFYLRHRERVRMRNRPAPRDLLGEGLALAQRYPLASVGTAFAAGFAASRSPAAEAVVAAALKQAVEQGQHSQ